MYIFILQAHDDVILKRLLILKHQLLWLYLLNIADVEETPGFGC